MLRTHQESRHGGPVSGMGRGVGECGTLLHHARRQSDIIARITRTTLQLLRFLVGISVVVCCRAVNLHYRCFCQQRRQLKALAYVYRNHTQHRWACDHAWERQRSLCCCDGPCNAGVFLSFCALDENAHSVGGCEKRCSSFVSDLFVRTLRGTICCVCQQDHVDLVSSG